MEDNKILMTLEDGSEIEFTILESTVFGGSTYILVTDAPDEEEDGSCYVLKDVSTSEDEEAIFESVEDDKEEDAVFAIFQELLAGEIDIE